MNKSKILLLIFALQIFLIGCAQSNPIEATAIAIPTSSPTAQPQATPTLTRLESGFFRFQNGNWQPIYVDEMTAPVFLPEDMVGGDFEQFQLIQYGYYVKYSTENHVLTLRARVFPGEIYRELQFQLDPNQSISCLPEKIKDVPIERISFNYSKGKFQFPSGMTKTTISEIISKLNDNSYFVIALSKPVQAQEPNSIQQITYLCK